MLSFVRELPADFRALPPRREGKIALVIATIATATALGWTLMLGGMPLGLSDICGGARPLSGVEGFSTRWSQWQIMLGTMMLPCVAPAIVALARAERQRYGILTAAMAFCLPYAGVVGLASSAAILLQPILSRPGSQGALFCLVLLIGLLRALLPHQPSADHGPVHAGLRRGMMDLPVLAQMILVQSAFASHHLIVMILMALAMPAACLIAAHHRRVWSPT